MHNKSRNITGHRSVIQSLLKVHLNSSVYSDAIHCIGCYHSFVSLSICMSTTPNDVLFISGLVAYWPARIHNVALLDLCCPHVTSGSLAVCYSQRRSIFSSATAPQPSFVDNNRDTVLLIEKN